MPISTNLNVSPYYDDANNAIADNYYRILFRPSTAVQARELTQIQDILQNQIEKFGDNIFTAGTIVKGCNFNFDPNYFYVKILDTANGVPVQAVSSYVGLLAHEVSSNLYAICVNSQDGLESQDPNLKTLYFKYLNSGSNNEQAFAVGNTISFAANTNLAAPFVALPGYDVKVASTANAVGIGYQMSVSDGVVYQKGQFINVANNTSVIVAKYTNQPDNTVAGFIINENIITEYQDTNLYDGAAGFTNYNAPGAHRLQLTPVLSVFPANNVPNTNFFALVEWEGGNIVRSYQQTVYSQIETEMARRTYDESGNYFINPFKIHMENGNSSYVSVVSAAGSAYIDGHRIEQINNIRTPVRKGTDTKDAVNQVISSNFNNSVLVQEYIGNIPSNIGANVALYDTASTAITSNAYVSATITPAGSQIGTAKIFGVQYASGTVGSNNCQFTVYLADIKMNQGKSFRNAKAIYYSGTPSGIADIVLTKSSTSNTYIAALQQPSLSSLVFDTQKIGAIGLTATKPNYTYRTVSNTVINSATGISNPISAPGGAVFPYSGNLTSSQENTVVVIPTSFGSGGTYANVTPSKTGTVAVTSTSANITGTSTSFTTDYQVGDYIATNGEIHRILTIANTTSMVTDRNYSSITGSLAHNKCYPINVPINFANRNSYISANNTSGITFSLVSANGQPEVLSNTITVNVYQNITAVASSDRALTVNGNNIVCFNMSNTSAGVAGPWCLGVPFAFNLRNVYRSSNAGTFVANTTASNTLVFTNTSNTSVFSNGMAVFGYGIPSGATANVVNSTALILTSNATQNTTNAVFNYGYYSNNAVDDITPAFYILDGQKDAIFDQSFLAKNPNYNSLNIGPTDLLTVVFDYFTPSSSGKGYISADSYTALVNNNIIGYENVPNYTSSSGTYYELRNAIDFRPFVQNTATYSTSLANASINPAYTSVLPNQENYIVASNQPFLYNINYYLGRIDKLTINSYGSYSIIEGQAAETPVTPSDKPDAMTLAVLNVPPYPSLGYTTLTSNTAQNYVVTPYVQKQNRRYTMNDIAKLDQRVSSLEYYTSLNLLEQNTSSLAIQSSVTGANRFKNGIFVDSFTDTSSLDITNIEHRASLATDETALVPRVMPTDIKFIYSNTSFSNTTINGSYITLSNTGASNSILSQQYGTDTISCSGVSYAYNGKVSLAPSYSSIPDLVPNTAPIVPHPYTIGQLDVRVTAYGVSQYGLNGLGGPNIPGNGSYISYQGATGTGNCPGGLLQISPQDTVMTSTGAISLLSGYFNTPLGLSYPAYQAYGAGVSGGVGFTYAPSGTGFTGASYIVGFSPVLIEQSGYFIAPETGSYTFNFCHYGAAGLVVGTSNQSFSSDAPIGSPSTLTVSLTAGQYYNFSCVANINTAGNALVDLYFTVNGNTYSANPTAGQKPITAAMFARASKPAVVGTAANTTVSDIYTLSGGMTSMLGINFVSNPSIVTANVSIPAPSPTVTTPIQTKPPLNDTVKYGGGGAGGVRSIGSNNIKNY
jgi:hypothetical protein